MTESRGEGRCRYRRCRKTKAVARDLSVRDSLHIGISVANLNEILLDGKHSPLITEGHLLHKIFFYKIRRWSDRANVNDNIYNNRYLIAVFLECAERKYYYTFFELGNSKIGVPIRRRRVVETYPRGKYRYSDWYNLSWASQIFQGTRLIAQKAYRGSPGASHAFPRFYRVLTL